MSNQASASRRVEFTAASPSDAMQANKEWAFKAISFEGGSMVFESPAAYYFWKNQKRTNG